MNHGWSVLAGAGRSTSLDQRDDRVKTKVHSPFGPAPNISPQSTAVVQPRWTEVQRR